MVAFVRPIQGHVMMNGRTVAAIFSGMSLLMAAFVRPYSRVSDYEWLHFSDCMQGYIIMNGRILGLYSRGCGPLWRHLFARILRYAITNGCISATVF